MKKIKIHSIVPGSIAEEIGIKGGDYLLSINGEEIKDIFDYRFLCSDEMILVEIENLEEGIVEIEIEKEESQELGIVFENELIEDTKSCVNKCIFCFIDQLPKGMRNTLYFKDDDSRLSFLTGNYVTLTNVSYEDIKRIINYRMSPINVSVHAVNKSLRTQMLNNKNSNDIMDKIKLFADARLEVNCQIVLCPDINDKNELDHSLQELGKFYPGVKSISVVPVGLTKYRQNLYPLTGYDKEKSIEVIKQIERWQKFFLKKYGTRIVYTADEFFIMAEYPIPPFDEYEDFPQIENGVGLISSFLQEISDFVSYCDDEFFKVDGDILSIATGTSFYTILSDILEQIKKKIPSLNVKIYPIINDFFGKTVTVTGLLTGRDIINQLSNKELGNRLLISRNMLKANSEVLLDDKTVADIERALNIKVQVVDSNGEDFMMKLLNKNCN